jgi:hypothetical protein
MLPVEGGATTIVIVTVWSPCDDAPRIVAVYVPLGAPPLRISVFTVLPVVGDGVKARKSVAGSPVTDSVTGPVNPGFRLMVTTGNQGSWLDGYTRNDVALTDSVKGPVCAGGAVIVSVTFNVCMVWPTLVPCTVKVVVPVAAAPPTLTVMVLDEVVASTWGGLNPTVTPVGSDVASNDTEPVKPPDRVIVTERLLFALRAMVSEDPEAAITNPPPWVGVGAK